MEREGTTELRREREGRINLVKEAQSGRLVVLSQNTSKKLWRGETLGARPRGGTEHAQWGAPPTRLLDTALGWRARPPRLAPGHSVFDRLVRPQQR